MSERTMHQQVKAIFTELPTPTSLHDLTMTIDKLLNGEYSPYGEVDYNEGPFVMAACAYVAFNYAASTIGASGFQGSGGELLFIAASRRVLGPLAVLTGEKLLYPQYNFRKQVTDMLDDWLFDWAPQEAKRLLAEQGDRANEEVRKHWEKLSKLRKMKTR